MHTFSLNARIEGEHILAFFKTLTWNLSRNYPPAHRKKYFYLIATLQYSTYSSRTSLLSVAARKGFSALPINIFTVTLGLEKAPVITRQPGALRLPIIKKVPPSK